MEFDHLHFSQPIWLWGLLAIPLILGAYILFFRPHRSSYQLEKFIDSHLLPYLLVGANARNRSKWNPLLWSVVWSLLILAIAGPRWDFKEIEMMSKDQSLVILLDLSESMNAADVKPSRLVRARQKIEDFLNQSQGVNIGLVAFAADPHMIAPLTDDKETIRHLLPTLETDLVFVQGSRLTPALEMADVMLDAEPGSNKALLIISDGDFEDGSAVMAAKKLADKGIVIHTMGMGTLEGAILQDRQGNSIKKNGAPIHSKLIKNKLEGISQAGNGIYFEGRHFSSDEAVILQKLEAQAASMEAGKRKRLWDERFYLLILPALPFLLWWFRRGALFSMLLLFLPVASLNAGFTEDYFMNSEQVGRNALEDGDYETAREAFQDPYRKGVACYKAGNYAEAEKLFRQSSRTEVEAEAAYNLGNALALQNKTKKAIAAYEEVLKKWPDHIKAKENRDFLKKMSEQQKQDGGDQSEDSDQQEDQNKDQSNSKNKNSKNKESENSEKDQSENDYSDSSQGQNEDKQNNETSSENEDQQNRDKDNGHENSPEDINKEENGDESEQEQPQSDPNENAEAQGGQEEEQKGDELMAQNAQEDDKAPRSQAEQDADFWLNRINNDPKTFMKNKFYIESKQSGATEGIDPW